MVAAASAAAVTAVACIAYKCVRIVHKCIELVRAYVCAPASQLVSRLVHESECVRAFAPQLPLCAEAHQCALCCELVCVSVPLRFRIDS